MGPRTSVPALRAAHRWGCNRRGASPTVQAIRRCERYRSVGARRAKGEAVAAAESGGSRPEARDALAPDHSDGGDDGRAEFRGVAAPLVFVGAVLCLYSSGGFKPVGGISAALGVPAAFAASWVIGRRAPGAGHDAELFVMLGVLACIPLIEGPLTFMLLGHRPPEGLTYAWPTFVAGAGLAALGRLRAERALAVWGAATCAAALVAAPLRGSNVNGANLMSVIVAAAALCLIGAGFFEARHTVSAALSDR